MKTIIVATDFSSCSINAAEYATELALSIGAEMHLFHFYEIPIGASEIPSAFDFHAMEQSAKDEMKNLSDRLSTAACGKLTITTTVAIGDVIDSLVEVSEKIVPVFVIIGSQGASFAQRALFGSNALNAITRIQFPLIIIPHKVKFAGFKKIAVACDLKDVIHTIPVDRLNEILQLFECELHIVNVGDQNKFDPETVFQSGLLEQLILNKKPYYHFIAGEDIDNEIIVFATGNKVDLLVFFPKKHNLVQKLFHKSHSRQAALHSHLPLLFIH